MPSLLLLLALATAAHPAVRPGAALALQPDTLRPGSTALSPSQLRPYTIARRLELTRGDSTRPFGRQSEQLVLDSLDGRAAVLHVLVFDTPFAVTVDSSWVDPATLAPRRMVSRNKNRTLVLEFGAGKVRTTITPADGATTVKEAVLPTDTFEWNMLPVALAALDLHEGDRLVLPSFSDRADRVTWYTVDVSADSLTRPSGRVAPMWRLRATPAGEAPSAEWWVSRRHHVLDQARVAEPGVAMLYARADL